MPIARDQPLHAHRAEHALSKSPESETTTVPVCLSASSEVVMADMGGDMDTGGIG
jgi:hypothetical protein